MITGRKSKEIQELERIYQTLKEAGIPASLTIMDDHVELVVPEEDWRDAILILQTFDQRKQ